MTEKEFYTQAEKFLRHLFTEIQRNQIELKPHWPMDHLCFRVQSEEAYQENKKEFEKFGVLLIESSVNGRLIATYKLNRPVEFNRHKIDVVELPAPKAGKKTIEGFEHAEVVVDEPLEKLMVKYQHLKLDTGGLKKPLNQELEIEMQGCALKFHPMSLEAVIEIEKNQRN